MVRFGRVMSTLVVLAVVALILLATLWPDLMHIGPIHVVDYLGMVMFVGAPVVWISAVVHWARHVPSERGRVRWGLIVVLGVVPGAMAYWFWGPRSSAQ